jgi:quercetin dioxygenase-like cupin family protein
MEYAEAASRVFVYAPRQVKMPPSRLHEMNVRHKVARRIEQMALKHVEPGEVAHLHAVGAALARSTTTALVKSDRFEAVRLIVPAGTTIPTHKVQRFITLLCLEGHAILGIDREIELRPGDWTYLERGTPHSVRAVEDSALLLTILFD